MIIVNNINCGTYPNLNLPIRRRLLMDGGEIFSVNCKVNNSNDGFITECTFIKVRFIQEVLDLNNNPIDEMTKIMYYVLRDEVASDEITNPRAFVTEFLSLWRTTTASSIGLGDKIEYTLSKLPYDFKDCEVVKSTWFV